MEKWNSQREHGQPMEQIRGLLCTCDSEGGGGVGGVARCQSQHHYHFWRMSAMFEACCAGYYISLGMRIGILNESEV